VFRVYCLTMHMTLINFLNFVIVNDHFDCRLSQCMVITNEIGSYEFIGMNETFLLNEFPTLEKSCWFGVSAVELDE
jgi:hypothetical protein